MLNKPCYLYRPGDICHVVSGKWSSYWLEMWNLTWVSLTSWRDEAKEALWDGICYDSKSTEGLIRSAKISLYNSSMQILFPDTLSKPGKFFRVPGCSSIHARSRKCSTKIPKGCLILPFLKRSLKLRIIEIMKRIPWGWADYYYRKSLVSASAWPLDLIT